MNSLASIRPDLQRIVLTGFMGSGKTSVGRLLAARLGWQFADLDRHVEAQEARTVPQIFSELGEAAFRRAEAGALSELLSCNSIVIALGGGAPETPRVRDLLANTPETAVIHLDATFPVLYDRCVAQALDPTATGRPLLGERNAAEARYVARQALYAAIADHRADASAPTPETVTENILQMLAARQDSLP